MPSVVKPVNATAADATLTVKSSAGAETPLLSVRTMLPENVPLVA